MAMAKVDLDVARARRLASELNDWADAIELGRWRDGTDLSIAGPFQAYEKRLRSRIRALNSARFDLHDPREAVRDNKQRDWVLANLGTMGRTALHLSRELEAHRMPDDKDSPDYLG